MEQLILIAHVLIAVAIIGLVLIQQGKGADIGAAMGSGASGSFFGSVGATSFLLKLTASLAILFFVTSLSLGYLAGKRSDTQDQQTVSEKLSRIQIKQDGQSPADATTAVAPAQERNDIPAITEKPAADTAAAEGSKVEPETAAPASPEKKQ